MCVIVSYITAQHYASSEGGDGGVMNAGRGTPGRTRVLTCTAAYNKTKLWYDWVCFYEHTYANTSNFTNSEIVLFIMFKFKWEPHCSTTYVKKVAKLPRVMSPEAALVGSEEFKNLWVWS